MDATVLISNSLHRLRLINDGKKGFAAARMDSMDSLTGHIWALHSFPGASFAETSAGIAWCKGSCSGSCSGSKSQQSQTNIGPPRSSKPLSVSCITAECCIVVCKPGSLFSLDQLRNKSVGQRPALQPACCCLITHESSRPRGKANQNNKSTKAVTCTFLADLHFGLMYT
jgi:hypothetical protein